MKKPVVNEEMKLLRMMIGKDEHEAKEVRGVEEMVPKRFYKYLKVFKKR